MKTISYYLDQAKKKTGSDYQTAKALGVTRQAISTYRKKGTMSAEAAANLADLLAVDFGTIIATCEAGKHPEKAKFWAKWIAATVILSVGIIAQNTDISAVYTASTIDRAIYYTHCALLVLGLIYAFRQLKNKGLHQ